MKSYRIKLIIENDKIVVDVPKKFIGKKVEVQITEIPKKVPMKRKVKYSNREPIIFEISKYSNIKPIDIVDEFPDWFQSNSLNEIDDSIENI